MSLSLFRGGSGDDEGPGDEEGSGDKDGSADEEGSGGDDEVDDGEDQDAEDDDGDEGRRRFFVCLGVADAVAGGRVALCSTDEMPSSSLSGPSDSSS